MSVMIPVASLSGKQFQRARSLQLPVVFDGEVFRLPSSRGEEEGEHVVIFDQNEEPVLYSCTCRAGRTGTPCWAGARAFDVLTLFAVNNVWIGRQPQGAQAPARTTVAPLAAPLEAGFTREGDLALLKRSATPLAGHVLNVP